MPPNSTIGRDEQLKIESAITDAELMTSGEIRLFIERHCQGNVMDRAAFIFHEVGMDQTAERNGVLIYLATESRQFAIIGDSGIHKHVGDELWHTVRTEMQHYFIIGDLCSGIIHGILAAGEALGRYFPRKADDRDELSNEIVFGK
ncbi:MAG: TPM domain-containing protein [Bacteroidota bacterium]